MEKGSFEIGSLTVRYYKIRNSDKVAISDGQNTIHLDLDDVWPLFNTRYGMYREICSNRILETQPTIKGLIIRKISLKPRYWRKAILIRRDYIHALKNEIFARLENSNANLSD